MGDGMGKLALFLICLAMLSVCHGHTFPRPWQNSTWIVTNPAIWNYGVEIWWDIPELNKVLESLDVQQAGQLEINGSAKDRLERAALYHQLANENRAMCMDSDVLGPLWGYTLGGPVLGTFTGLLYEFSRISSCVAYGQNWIDSMDYSLSALEESIRQAEGSLSAARAACNEIEFMGLCDSTYTHAGSEHCAEMQSAFNTIDSNITEGKYGKYPLLFNYSHELDAELGEPIPNMFLFGTMMGLIWTEDGIISSFEAVSLMAEDAKNKSDTEFQLLVASAEGRKKIVSQEMQELKRQDLHLITEAPSSYEVRKPGTVSALFAGIQEREDKISIQFSDAKLERDRLFKKGYMANAIISVSDVDSAYGELITDIEDLEEHAQEVVSIQAAEAESELAKTRQFIESSARSSEAIALYEEAERCYNEGEKATTLGKKFAAYSKAAASARAARIARPYGEELDTKSSLKELEKLISNAEKDEINVATERESLKLLEGLQPYQIEEHISSAIYSIILKARAKYDDLLVIRARLYDKLALAGPSAADLYTDLERYEVGIAEGGQIRYPEAIGQLKQLRENYLALEDELEQYTGDIVGNSMSTTAIPLIDSVWLDEPSNITLDIVITNARNYGSESATVKVYTPASLEFLYSDIAYGREGAESLRMADDSKTVILVLADVKPFETRRITLRKQSIVAHTLKREVESHGTGNGGAAITERLDFELDTDINRLHLPDGYESALIDGAGSSRPLKAGKHRLSSKRTMDNAYTEKIDNINSYSIGTNSRVEYDIRISPNIDLDSVLVFIDSLNDTRISSLNIVAATGEGLKDKKRVSESQYTATAAGLKKDRQTVLKVSYLVEDTASFVSEQIKLLESANLSDNSRELLDQARTHAESGNYSTALEFLEKSRALQKEEEKQRTKIQKQCSELNKELVSELGEITEALSKTNISVPLTDKLTARKSELERLLEESEGADLTQRADILDKADYKWLEKELKSFTKDAYKEYNDLKERFYLAGNSSTPPPFLEFESALNKLESGSRLEYAIQAVGALEKARKVVESQEDAYQAQRRSMGEKFEITKSQIEAVLERYSKEAASAKGTEYSSLFGESESRVKDLLKEAEKSLGGDPRAFYIKLDNLNKSAARMQLTLDSLEKEGRARLSLVETLLSQSELDERQRREAGSKIDVMAGMLEAGEYVNALRAGSAVAKEIESYEGSEDNSLLILGITALAVLAIVAAYMVRQQKGGEKKQLRKLERNGEIPEPLQDTPDE